jgi:hypothetical protein
MSTCLTLISSAVRSEAAGSSGSRGKAGSPPLASLHGGVHVGIDGLLNCYACCA